jgi:hypothetical protein
MKIINVYIFLNIIKINQEHDILWLNVQIFMFGYYICN